LKCRKKFNVLLLILVPEESSTPGACGGRDQDGIETSLQSEKDRQRRIQRNSEKMCPKGNFNKFLNLFNHFLPIVMYGELEKVFGLVFDLVMSCYFRFAREV
jgi:hypothetical protein